MRSIDESFSNCKLGLFFENGTLCHCCGIIYLRYVFLLAFSLWTHVNLLSALCLITLIPLVFFKLIDLCKSFIYDCLLRQKWRKVRLVINRTSLKEYIISGHTRHGSRLRSAFGIISAFPRNSVAGECLPSIAQEFQSASAEWDSVCISFANLTVSGL